MIQLDFVTIIQEDNGVMITGNILEVTKGNLSQQNILEKLLRGEMCIFQQMIIIPLLGAICVSDIICFAISFWDLFDVIGFDLVQMSKLFGIVCNAAICMILWRPQKKYHPPF